MSTPSDDSAPPPGPDPRTSADPGPRPPSNRTMIRYTVWLGALSIPLALCCGLGLIPGALSLFAAYRGSHDDPVPTAARVGLVLGIVGILLSVGVILLLILAPEQRIVR